MHTVKKKKYYSGSSLHDFPSLGPWMLHSRRIPDTATNPGVLGCLLYQSLQASARLATIPTVPGSRYASNNSHGPLHLPSLYTPKRH